MIYARGTGDGIAWNGGERGTGGRRERERRRGDGKGDGRGEEKGRKTSITEINLPALIVKNNRFIDSS